MPDLSFEVLQIEAMPQAATASFAFKTRVVNRSGARLVHSAMIQCRVEIDPARRCYTGTESSRLNDLFGSPARWGQTLRPLLWTEIGVCIPTFSSSIDLNVIVPCSGDLALAASRYLFALEGGVVNISLGFRGTVYYESDIHGIQATLIAVDSVRTQISESTWQNLIENYHPGGGWLTISAEVLDRLACYRNQIGGASWESAIESLLESANAGNIA